LSDEYTTFDKLLKIATLAELEMLTNYPKANVRAYAFWGIRRTTRGSLFLLVKKHLQDTTIVRTQFGCTSSEIKVGDFFIQFSLDSEDTNEIFSDQEMYELDSLLLYNKTSLFYGQYAIAHSGGLRFYTKIKEYALAKNPIALVSLAKFKQEIDIPIILAYKNTTKNEEYLYTYLAISYFPHSIFFSFLEKQLRESFTARKTTDEWKTLYKAVASYKNPQAKDLLNLVFSEVKNMKTKKKHYQYLYNALKEHYTPIYNDLLFLLWDKSNLIDKNLFDSLALANPNKTLVLTKESLKNVDKYFELSNPNTYESMFSEDTTANIFIKMLDFLAKNDRNEFEICVERGILRTDVNSFPDFCSQVAYLSKEKQVKILFQRLVTESNPHIYLEIVKILVKLGEQKIVHKAMETNKALTEGWGAEALKKLLE
jgi:hypothetical protein